jgi:hypothetical protein
VSFDGSSSLRRSGQRDDRRRRLLADDLSGPDEGTPVRVWRENVLAAQKSESYGNADFLERQWRLLDLVPRRLPMLALILLAGVVTEAGLEAAYYWMIERVAAGHDAVVALDLGVKGSLACWFSSLTLLAASVAALLVYNVRRHRADDYQGRYRVWRWAAVCWFFLATDQAASLREAFRDAMIGLSGTPLLGDGSLWWVAVYVFVFGAVGSRLLVDMRPSRLSICALLTAAVAYGLAATSWLGCLPVVEGATAELMFRVGCEMAGGLMLLAAMALHARYVILDAEGLLPRRESRAEDEPDEDESDDLENEAKILASNNQWRAVDQPHPTPQPAYQRPASPSPPAPVAASASTPPPLNRKLTKGERKALKERLLRERCEREKWK